jgi:hypothetical protein
VLRGKHRVTRRPELGASAQRSPTARPAVPRRTWTPDNLQGAEGALEKRASGPLAVLKRAGQQALRSRALRQQATQSRARSEQPGVVDALWWWVVGGGGPTRRRRAGRAGGGEYAKRRCGRGAWARHWEGAPVRTLWGAVEAGGTDL